MYTVFIGFIVALIVALIVSEINREPDCDDPDLFTPFVAKRLIIKKRLKNKRAEMVNFHDTYFTFFLGFLQ